MRNITEQFRGLLFEMARGLVAGGMIWRRYFFAERVQHLFWCSIDYLFVSFWSTFPHCVQCAASTRRKSHTCVTVWPSVYFYKSFS